MNNKERKEDNLTNTPATEVKQYTFGAEEDLTQVKNVQTKAKRKNGQTHNKQNKKSQQQTKQNYKKPKRKYKKRRKPARITDIEVVETAEDVRKDNLRIEKEILLDIKEINRIKI